MPQEIELKLALPPTARQRLLAHPLIASAVCLEAPALLVNTYFDTPDFALRERRIALRTRRVEQRWLQTVKCAASSAGGLSSRPEWEQAYNGRFDFSAIDDDEVRAYLKAHADHIAPVFTTDFERETRVAEPRAGVRILIMIDSGRIEANGREEAISEVELELAEGEPGDLFDFALQLAASLPLLPEDASKAQRGYALFDGAPAAPVHSGQTRIDPHATAVDAFQTLAHDCLGAWQANVAFALHSDDGGFIHQARVATRRLRSLIVAFAQVLPDEFVTHWSGLLGELAERLAMARSLDAIQASVVAPLTATGEAFDDIVARLLGTRLAQEAAVVRAAVRADLAEAGTGVPMLALARALYELPPSDADLPVLARRACRQAKKHLAKRLAEVRTTQQGAQLHALRIACKRLRYLRDALAPALPHKSRDKWSRQLVRVQNELGYLNDLRAAQSLFTEWAGTDVALLEARAYLLGWHAHAAARARAGAIKRLRRLLRQ